MSIQHVVRYSMWAGVLNKNEPFLDFSLMLCQTIGEKGKLGELGDWELMDWNNLSRVSRGFNGKTGFDWLAITWVEKCYSGKCQKHVHVPTIVWVAHQCWKSQK